MNTSQHPEAPFVGEKHSVPLATRPASARATDGQAKRSAPSPAASRPKTKTYEYKVEKGARHNSWMLGKLLASIKTQLFRASEGGLIEVLSGDRIRRIASAKDLATLLIDTLRIRVTKAGKLQGEMPSASILSSMLASERFLGHFRPVDEITTIPAYLPDFTITQPGYNARTLHLGPPAVIADGLATINKFLAVMDWGTAADRTNAVAAALTVQLRHHFPGGKPLVLVTATKSHAGKGTVIEFIRGSVPKAEILYQDKDWPMRHELHRNLVETPEIGLINLDNVRLDSSGRGKMIRTGFLESLVTSPEVSLSAPGVKAGVRTANKFVVAINTNDGTLSPDLLNRALPIHLAPTGDVTMRESPIGNPKLEFLPAHRGQIEAELRGMIERWKKRKQPLDEAVAWHPMSVWAKTIGGILLVNGFQEFLVNYGTTRAVADPIREALGILAAVAPGKAQRPGEWAELAVQQGLASTLLKAGERETEAGRERAMGVLLSPYQDEFFERRTETHRMVFKPTKAARRWDKGGFPHVRYTFEVVTKEPLHELLATMETPSEEVKPSSQEANAPPQAEAEDIGLQTEAGVLGAERENEERNDLERLEKICGGEKP